MAYIKQILSRTSYQDSRTTLVKKDHFQQNIIKKLLEVPRGSTTEKES